MLTGIIRQLIFGYIRFNLTIFRLRFRVVLVKLLLSKYSSNISNPAVSKPKSPAARKLETEDKVTYSNKNGEMNISL